MDAIVIPLIGVLASIMVLVVIRWAWIHAERRKLSRIPSSCDANRFNPHISEDEYDQTHSGRVIKRLRSRVVEGRVEIHWEFNAPFIHRGFLLTAKCRRNDGDWQPLAMEACQDSGTWGECFNYGESRSYVFTVKKTYYFFGGLFGEEGDEILYDQISFSVRKGKYLKEMKEVARDHRELAEESKGYMAAEQELRKMMRHRHDQEPTLPKEENAADRWEKKRKARSELNDYVERMTAEINANPKWSEERKRREIDNLQQTVEEAQLD